MFRSTIACWRDSSELPLITLSRFLNVALKLFLASVKLVSVCEVGSALEHAKRSKQIAIAAKNGHGRCGMVVSPIRKTADFRLERTLRRYYVWPPPESMTSDTLGVLRKHEDSLTSAVGAGLSVHRCTARATTLQARHQRGRGNPLPRNIRQDDSNLCGTHIEKIVIISVDHLRLDAMSGLVERL
jgi:hypothetical protein